MIVGRKQIDLLIFSFKLNWGEHFHIPGSGTLQKLEHFGSGSGNCGERQ